MQRVEWIAGLMEGEGYFSINNRPDPKHNPRFQVGVVMTDEDVIRSLHRTTGLGSVRGPHKQPGGNLKHKVRWTWGVQRREEVRILLTTIYPYMHSRRKEQIEKILNWLDFLENDESPRGVRRTGKKFAYELSYKGEHYYRGGFGTAREAHIEKEKHRRVLAAK